MKMKKGLSVLELIISISIMIIISSIVFFSFHSLNDRTALNSEINFIKSALIKTRNNSINSKDDINHSFTFSSTTISYDNNTFALNNGISLYYTNMPNTIIFNKISGISNASGTITYQLKKGNNIIATSTIFINSLGIIE